MKNNRIQFAVVREDPRIEFEAMAGQVPSRVLLIGSGGCTALTLQGQWPDTSFTLVDPNSAQLDLIRTKVNVLSSARPDAQREQFNVGNSSPEGLSQCGNFESLFRALRGFLHEFVADTDEIRSWFQPPPHQSNANSEALKLVFANPYWPVAFAMFFSDGLLNAMFGDAATQHASPNSYPGYFRQRLEKGLCRADAADNYFLHHIFLGEYRKESPPPFLAEPAKAFHFEYMHGTIDQVLDVESYDLVDLSNIMDWMAPNACRQLAKQLRTQMRAGATIMWRQLNNAQDCTSWFQPEFQFDQTRDADFTASERSLFYSHVHTGIKAMKQ